MKTSKKNALHPLLIALRMGHISFLELITKKKNDHAAVLACGILRGKSQLRLGELVNKAALN
jgi:hypothetical protein